MTIVVISAYNDKSCAAASSEMANRGMVESSHRYANGVCPAVLTSKMLTAMNVEVGFDARFEALTPGRAWELSAANYVIESAEVPIWGWASPHNIYTSNFWSSLDTNTRLLFVYQSPQRDLAYELSSGSLELSSLPRAAERWNRYHSTLLSLLRERRHLTRMIHLDELANESEFSRLCSENFGFENRVSCAGERVESDAEEKFAELYLHACGPALFDCSDVYEELQSVADLPAFETEDFREIASSAWAETKRLRDAVQSQTREIEDLQLVERERDHLKQRISGADQEHDRVTKQLLGVREECESLKAELKWRASSELASLRKLDNENRLLSLQLAQVQEELLEKVDTDWDEMNVVSVSASNEASQAKKLVDQFSSGNVTIDMREMIEGENWHHPEDDGRWAGPGKVSNLVFPAMVPGLYTLEVLIVDSMARDIIDKMTVSFDGQTVKPYQFVHPGVIGLFASMKRTVKSLLLQKARYPLLLRAKVEITNHEQDRHVIEFAFPRTVSPASFGAADTRDLTIRVGNVRLSGNAFS